MRIKKTYLYLILIVTLAIVLRVVAAHNTDVGTDEMIYSLIPLGIIGSGQLNTIEGAPVYFYITDIGYKLFGGITAVSVRFTSILFGAFASLVIFLIAIELFDDKNAALISAFLFAVSSFALSYNTEMDMTAYFFALLSILFFMKSFTNPKNLYLSFLFLVIGALSKPIVLALAVPFCFVFVIHYFKKNAHSENKIIKIEKRLVKILLITVIISIIAASPVLIYNYLTYTSTGSTDYYFASILGIGEYPIGGVSQQTWSFAKFSSISTSIFFNFLKKDIIVLLFGLGGSLWFFRKKLLHSLTLWLSALLILIYVAGKAGGGQHHLLLPAVLSIFGGYALVHSSELIKSRFRFNHFILAVLVIALVLSMVTLQKAAAIRENATTLVLRDFVVDNIEKEAIVVTDPRIFNGLHAWVFNDRYFISGTDFAQIMTSLSNVPKEQRVLVPVYYLECNPITYCGWKPEDFNRISAAGEQITQEFKEITEKVADINAGHHFIVRSAFIQVPIQLYDIIDKSKTFWGYPIGWNYPEQAVDHYDAQGLGNILNGFGLLVLYIDVIIALLSIPFVVYLVKKV